MNQSFWSKFFKRNETKTVIASLISIIIGMAAGSIIIAIVGLTNESMGGKSVLDGIRIVFAGMFCTGRDLTGSGALNFGFNPVETGNMLFRATPLILTGLSVALAYKTGLFNIGAPGQYLAGTAATLFIALSIPVKGSQMTEWHALQDILAALNNPETFPVMSEWMKNTLNVDASALIEQWGILAKSNVPNDSMVKSMIEWMAGMNLNPSELLNAWQTSQGMNTAFLFPAWSVWTLAFIGGLVAGAVWGALPGLMKAILNINEVIACIMTNWIAANLVSWLFDMSNLKNMFEGTKTTYIYKSSFNGVETPKLGLDKIFTGSQVNGGIIIAILLAVVVLILLSRTTFGYELKACGSNRFAARYAGIKDKRSIVVSMALAGSLAGAAGALYSLAGNTEFAWNCYQSLPAVGFNGIPVALLAANNPIGVVFSGMFMSMLNICGSQLTKLTSFNEYITDVIIAVIVYLSAFSLVIKQLISGVKKRRNGKEAAK